MCKYYRTYNQLFRSNYLMIKNDTKRANASLR
nr:MAG TPA: hypothetical protein [Caudoviricetes sp.]